MFERYTEKARRAIFFGRYEASQYGSHEIDTEHLLLGLVREARGVLVWTPGLTAGEVRKRIDAHTHHLPATAANASLPLSREANQALKFAVEEADRLAHKHIGTEHLFLGILDVTGCFASKLLRESGADAAAIRQHYAQPAEPPKPPNHGHFNGLPITPMAFVPCLERPWKSMGIAGMSIMCETRSIWSAPIAGTGERRAGSRGTSWFIARTERAPST